MYPEELVKPMREDLTNFGFEELKTAADVNSLLEKKGTALIVLNSVCGCAARNARPAAKLSVQNESRPDHITTIFAGVDIEAVNTAREHMLPFPPSSPCIALFKDGELVHMLERQHIEGRSSEMIAENLIESFNTHC